MKYLVTLITSVDVEVDESACTADIIKDAADQMRSMLEKPLNLEFDVERVVKTP